MVTNEFDFPFNDEVSEKLMKQKLKETDDESKKIRCVDRLLIARDMDSLRKYAVSALSFGPNTAMLALPGEVCVEYQLYANEQATPLFLACTAYGDCAYHYIPTAKMYDEGGYEPEVGAVSTPAIEEKLKKAISEVVDILRNSNNEEHK